MNALVRANPNFRRSVRLLVYTLLILVLFLLIPAGVRNLLGLEVLHLAVRPDQKICYACLETYARWAGFLERLSGSKSISSLRLKLVSLEGSPLEAVSVLREQGDWPPQDLALAGVTGRALIKVQEWDILTDLLQNSATCSGYFMLNFAAQMDQGHYFAEERQAYESIYHLCGDRFAGTQALTLLSNLEYRQDNIQAAIQWSKLLSEIAPLDLSNWSELARLNLEAGKLDEALVIAEHGLQLDSSSKNLGPRAVRGAVYLRQKQYSLAIENLEFVEKAGSTSPWNRVSLARAYQQVGRIADARQIVKKVLAGDPTFQPALSLWKELEMAAP